MFFCEGNLYFVLIYGKIVRNVIANVIRCIYFNILCKDRFHKHHGVSKIIVALKKHFIRFTFRNIYHVL